MWNKLDGGEEKGEVECLYLTQLCEFPYFKYECK